MHVSGPCEASARNGLRAGPRGWRPGWEEGQRKTPTELKGTAVPAEWQVDVQEGRGAVG